MKEIETRSDIEVLVHAFYDNVRKDPKLGPIFNTVIPEFKWPAHLTKLTDFWETGLFGIPKYKGNPVLSHQHTDAKMNFSIEQEHFGQWLHLWFETIDALFVGAKAERAKQMARKIATGQYLAIWNARPAQQKSAEEANEHSVT